MTMGGHGPSRLSSVLRRVPIGVQVVIGGFLAGILLWLILDHFQTARLNEVFKADVAARLDDQSSRERLKFGQSVRTHQGYVRLLLTQDGMAAGLRAAFGAVGAVRHQGMPPWLPARSVRRLFAEPDLFLVFDEAHRLRTVYRLRDIPFSKKLLEMDSRLIGQSEREPLLQMFDDGMFLVSSASAATKGGSVTLMGVSRLDGRFLREAQGALLSEGTITALVTGGDRMVIASSQPSRVPPRMRVDELQGEFLVVGKGFFDYGFSEVWAGFVIFVERSRVESLIRPIVALERTHRTVLALAMSALFALVLLYVTFRVERLSSRVADFMTQAFGVAPEGSAGDELSDLDAKVERLTHEVLASRAALDADNQALERQVEQRTAELRRALVEARAATDAKSRFLAAASHDLRQPLQAVRLYEALLRTRFPGNEMVLDQLGHSIAAAEGLLNALLDMSKIEAGVVAPVPSRFPLGNLLHDVRREFSLLAQDAGSLLLVMESSIEVEADFGLLGRIVKNLVSNAVKHGGGGRILVGARRDGGGARIEVWDEGPGIPSQDMSLIFEEFYQLTNPERDREKGLGLGLAIAKKLSDLCGFHLSVRSVLGRGSVFMVHIPDIPAEAAEADLCAVPA